jgi:hypothetical protein
MWVWKNNNEGKPNNLVAVARSYSTERAKSKATHNLSDNNPTLELF